MLSLQIQIGFRHAERYSGEEKYRTSCGAFLELEAYDENKCISVSRVCRVKKVEVVDAESGLGDVTSDFSLCTLMRKNMYNWAYAGVSLSGKT